MNKQECFYFGQILRTFRNDGQVVAHLEVDEPELYEDIEFVFLEIGKEMGFVPFFIDDFHLRQQNEAVITFTDVNSEKEALHIKGARLYLPETILPQLEGTQFYYHEIESWEVVDKTLGSIGHIKSVIENPSNPLLQILSKDKKEILIPINDKFITLVDRENCRLNIDAPEGLIELYLSEDN